MPKLRRKRRKNLSPTSKEKSRSLEEDFNGKADRSYRPHIRYADRYKKVEDRKPGRPMWLCQCECGNTVVVSSTNLLRTNSTKSCGCLRHTPSPTLIDLRGKTFGKLKVIEKDPDSKPGKTKWICECKCGNIVSVLSDSLRNGKTRSCGCARFSDQA